MYRMGQEEINAVARVIESRQLFKVNSGSLQEAYNFEKELKDKFGVGNTILMTSGHAALAAALVGMGIGPGDEVIVPAYTYIATAELSITVNVRYTNNVNHKEDFERQFTASQTYETTQSLNAVQEELVTQIIDDLVDQIFNATVANW